MASGGMDIDYVARLARLELSADERARFTAQLGDVLTYVEKLQRVDAAGIEPTAHAFPLENVLDEDEPRPGLSPLDALANAPARRAQQIVVPKVVEDA